MKVTIFVWDGEYTEEIVIEKCKTFEQLTGNRHIKVNNAVIKLSGEITKAVEEKMGEDR